jgi:uncharacterized protein YggU (UPF0235/DUF167 family)
MKENELVIKQPPLKGTTVNVVFRLLLSDFQRPKDDVIISCGTKTFFLVTVIIQLKLSGPK